MRRILLGALLVSFALVCLAQDEIQFVSSGAGMVDYLIALKQCKPGLYKAKIKLNSLRDTKLYRIVGMKNKKCLVYKTSGLASNTLKVCHYTQGQLSIVAPDELINFWRKEHVDIDNVRFQKINRTIMKTQVQACKFCYQPGTDFYKGVVKNKVPACTLQQL